MNNATIPGKNNLACHAPKSATPATAHRAINPPPTLCAKFQKDIFVPLSFTENQCTITLPQGGQPMPWNQPLINKRQNMIAMEPVANGNIPMAIMVSAESTSPNDRKTQAWPRSQT